MGRCSVCKGGRPEGVVLLAVLVRSREPAPHACKDAKTHTQGGPFSSLVEEHRRRQGATGQQRGASNEAAQYGRLSPTQALRPWPQRWVRGGPSRRPAADSQNVPGGVPTRVT